MKKKLLFFLSLIVVAFICFAAIAMMKGMHSEDVILNQTNNVFDGTIGDIPARMMIYRDGSRLTAYYIFKNDNTEYSLTGSYNRITRHFKLSNNDKTILLNGSIHPNAESNDYYILTGSYYSSEADTERSFDLIPAWGLDGEDKDSIYQYLGYDTAQVEAFTDHVIELVRADDREALSQLMSYPLSVVVEGEQMLLNNEQEFLAQYDDIMTADFRSSLTNSFTRYLWGNYNGIQLGDNGRGFLFYKGSEDKDMKIISISNNSPDFSYPSNEDNGITQG
jgi:hypothetical protein